MHLSSTHRRFDDGYEAQLRVGEVRDSVERARRHLHVQCPDGEAKFWLEPQIALAQNYGLDYGQLWTVAGLIEEHADEICAAWDRHFGG